MTHALDTEFDPGFYVDHASLFDELMQSVAWDESMNARKTASFGKPYDYSQMTYMTRELLPCLAPLRNQLVRRLDIPFNNCLMNLYENGQNSMGFHSDETDNLMSGSGVAIVSLGGTRTLTFRSADRLFTHNCVLNAGTLLYMRPGVQDEWQHAIKKQDSADPRISLTWRAVQ